MKDVLTSLLQAGIIGVGLVIIGVLALQRVDTYLRLKAISQCARMATVRWTNDAGAEITEPFQPVYKQCLKKQGIK